MAGSGYRRGWGGRSSKGAGWSGGRAVRANSAALAGRAKPATRPGYPCASRAITGQPAFPGQVQRIWNVPPRNPHFNGRAAELGKLARGLAAGSRVSVESVRGVGGVGKSQLAIEYAHAHASDYELVWWINAEKPAAIADQFTTLATQL